MPAPSWLLAVNPVRVNQVSPLAQATPSLWLSRQVRLFSTLKNKVEINTAVRTRSEFETIRESVKVRLGEEPDHRGLLRGISLSLIAHLLPLRRIKLLGERAKKFFEFLVGPTHPV